jgi:hypothetical protein
MAQPPFLVDQIQIDPGSGDTLTIGRYATDGSLRFVDAVVTGGINLSELAGIRNATGVYVVGSAGAGAAYTSVQDALDAIPTTSSASNPSLVLILPGVYQEDVAIVRDGVYLVGLGGVRIVNATATHTITVKASIDTTPSTVLLRNLTVECTEDANAAIRLLGADTFATGTVTVDNAPLTAGDTITIGGVTLTGVSGTRTSGSNDFSVNGTTEDDIASEIAAALNDASNAFTGIVTASAALNVVTLTAVTAGSTGNSITIAVATSVAGDLVASGATLAGGSAAGNQVLSDALLVDNCTLIASGVGSFQILAETVNHVYVRGGTFFGSSSTSILSASNTALFSVSGVGWVNDVELAYDSGLDQPSDATSAYTFHGCPRVDDMTVDLSGVGSLRITDCPSIASVSQGGDRTLQVVGSAITGALTLSDTVAATTGRTTRGSVVLGGGTPTLSESRVLGTATFAASAAETISFTIAQPDTSYSVSIEPPAVTQPIAVRNKTVNGFDLDTAPAYTGTVDYIVFRDQ